jgi:hypothetical protein
MKPPNRKFRKTISFLPRITEGDPNYKRLKVYLFGSSHFTLLSISKEHKIEQLIVHVIRLADIDPQIGTCFNDFPVQIRGNVKDPELYEMRLLEDEDTSINSVNFCRTKDFEEIIEYTKTSITLFSTIELKTEQNIKAESTLRVGCKVMLV